MNHIQSLHYPATTLANEQVKKTAPWLEHGCLRDLKDLSAIARYSAEKALGQAEAGALPQPSGPLTDHRNVQALAVTDACGCIYEYVTGLPATVVNDPITDEAGGRFLNFLKVIFGTLGVQANLAHCARTVREKRMAEQA